MSNTPGKPHEVESPRTPATLRRSEQHVYRVLSRIAEKRHYSEQNTTGHFEPEEDEGNTDQHK